MADVPNKPLDGLKNGIILPESGSPGERRLKVEIEILKFLTAALNPVAGATLKLTHDVMKVFKDFRREEKDANISEFLLHLGHIVASHERRLTKLEAPTPAAVEKEPFAAVFLQNMEAAYNDDEKEKARFYAAFAAGMHESGSKISAPRKVILFDALKQLRAHDLLVMKTILEAVNRVAPADRARQKYPRLQTRELLAEVEPGKSAVDPGLIDHSLNALARVGLVRIDGGVVRAVVYGQPDEGVTVVVLGIGQELMGLILPYLPEAWRGDRGIT